MVMLRGVSELKTPFKARMTVDHGSVFKGEYIIIFKVELSSIAGTIKLYGRTEAGSTIVIESKEAVAI